MDYDLVDIPLKEIDSADLTYQISTDEEFTDLALSIGAIGLLYPPCLVKKESIYTVISGFRRISACRSLGKEVIPARILPPDLPKERYARIAISDNALQRSLNAVEQSRSYQIILRCIDTMGDVLVQDVAAIAKSVGLPGKKKALEHIRPIAKMPIFLQRSILEGTMSVAIASEVCRWELVDARLLNDLFNEIRPGLNNQRELITLISEISLRDDLPVRQIIHSEVFKKILSDEKRSAPQKLQSIRSHLKKVRFPSLSQREDEFYQSLKSMKLNTRIQISPPRFFEGSTFRVSMNVDSRSQLRSLMPELRKLIAHPDFLPE
jgi:ParB family chromosome partitioning protein